MDIYQHIGGRIRSLREEVRFSQEELAKALDVSTNTVSRWETATYKLSIKDLEKVAKHFKVKLSTFLPPEENKENTALVNTLLSATGDLTDEDINELIEFAEFRRVRRLLQEAKKK